MRAIAKRCRSDLSNPGPGVNVHAYAFQTHGSDNITLSPQIPVTGAQPASVLAESDAFDSSRFTVDTSNLAFRAMIVDATCFVACNSAIATTIGADYSQSPIAQFTTGSGTPTMVIKNCRGAILNGVNCAACPTPNFPGCVCPTQADALAGTIWFIDGFNANQVCGRPSINNCQGAGKVCYCQRISDTQRTIVPICGSCPGSDPLCTTSP